MHNCFCRPASRAAYKAAVIGLGRIGFSLAFDRRREQPAAHCAALSAEKRIILTAGCDSDEVMRKNWHAYYSHLPVYESADDLLTDEHPDIVTVAVSEESHLSVASSVLSAKPRLMILEKPAALNTGDGQKILALADAYGVPVMVNHERRFAVDYRLAKSWIPRIGSPQEIRASIQSGMKVYDPAEETTGAYSLLHDGTHLVDIVRFLFDTELMSPQPVSVCKDASGAVRNAVIGYTICGTALLLLSFSGRSRFFGFDVDIYGTEGRIHIGNGFCHLYLRAESRLYSGFYSLERQPVNIPAKTRYFANMVAHAANFLDGCCPLESTLLDAVADIRVLDDIKKLI